MMLIEAGGQPHAKSHFVKDATASASIILHAERPAKGLLSALLSKSQKNIFEPFFYFKNFLKY
jgi:hypothetical protein